MKKCIILILAGGIGSFFVWWILSFGLQNNKEEVESTKNKGKEVQQNDFLAYEAWVDFDETWSDIEKEWAIPYADDEVLKIVKAAYDEVDFFGVFETGDVGDDRYKEMYWEIIQNRKTILDKDTNEREFLKDIVGVSDYINIYDIAEFEFYFFDIDGDSLPELGISGSRGMGTYFIDYWPDTEEFVLWYPMPGGWYTLIGTRKVQWNNNGNKQAYYMLNQEGEEECETFGFELHYSEETSLYMVMLPQYTDEEKKIIVTENMRRQGVFEESSGAWYFRVTETQYNDLMKCYREAYDIALENVKLVTYTYEELFGSFEMDELRIAHKAKTFQEERKNDEE